MYKGIFWCRLVFFDDDMCYPEVMSVKAKCDLTGAPLEEVEFSSKSGDNFNHQIEWQKWHESRNKPIRNPYNYYPRGRVEIKNGKIKIFANPVILEDEEAKENILKDFELEEVGDKITWIADNSKHYQYLIDMMGGGFLDDEDCQ